MIRSCITVFYLAHCALLAADHAGSSPRAPTFAPPLPASRDDPDRLYRQRDDPAAATRAAEIWAERLAKDPQDFDAAWKLARARYWLGTHGLPPAQRRAALEAGIDAARAAVAAKGDRPDGHFWMAANMGALAESFGLRQGLRYRTPIRQSLERVLAIDPGYLQGSADRALGRWHHRVPALFGGSNRRAEEHLRKALTYNPESVITRLFLAELLVDLDRRDEARRELAAAMAAPEDPEWAPEDRRFKEQAKALLRALSR